MSLLEMTGVSKRYGGVQALAEAHLVVEKAQVHGLLGPNGSGKSTLNKVLTGTVKPDRAHIRLAGQDLQINRPLDAYHHRISAVYQQLSLIPQLTVAENLLLGTEITGQGFLKSRKMRAAAEEAIAPFWPGLDEGTTLDTEVSRLSPGSQQLVEVAKAMARKPQILVLDEATASLRRDQVQLVFDQVHALIEQEVSVVFVSHRLEEILALCSHATILRNGQTVATVDLATTSQPELVQLMVGEELTSAPPNRTAARGESRDQVVLAVKNLHSETLTGVDLEVQAGEIVGLGGLQGQGQSDLLHVLFGDWPHSSGTISTGGRVRDIRHPRGGIGAGLALVPGDRSTQGLFMKRPILENLSIVSLPRRLRGGVFVSLRQERKVGGAEVQRLRIKIGSLDDPVSSLSGGNQQKVVLGKWLLDQPQVVLLDDPTKGVDIGAKSEIYSIIRELTAAGVGVVLNSSDDEELLELCDRVLVMYEGAVVDHLIGDEITKDNLVAAALRVEEKGGDHV